MSDHQAGFRAQQRFSDPAESEPAEWTAPTPPNGLPLGYTSRPLVPQHDDPAPYLDLSTVALLGQPKRAPSQGWRKWLYFASFKLINVGESAKVNRHNSLVAQVQQPLRGCYRIALLSLKGGVGKTTITATLGATFASIRGDRVVAVDANPDRGTLSQKVPLETPATVRHLLRDAEGIEAYSDVRGYTSQGPSRLEVLASESDPAVSEAFSSDDYTRTLEVLERFYSLVLTDCGTGMLHSAMSAVLDKADVLVVDQLRIGRRRPQRLGHVGLAGCARSPGDGAQLDRRHQRGAAAVGQGRHEEGGRSLLAAVPCRQTGAIRPASGGGRGDQPRPAEARDAGGADRIGGRGRGWFFGRTAA